MNEETRIRRDGSFDYLIEYCLCKAAEYEMATDFDGAPVAEQFRQRAKELRELKEGLR